MRIDLVLPRFKPPTGAERLVLSLGQALAAAGAEVHVVCHSFDPGCRALARGLFVEETGTRMDPTGNHYLDSILGYLLSFRLARRIGRSADVVCLFGPALPLAPWVRRRGRRVFYFCYEPPRVVDVDREDVLARVGGWRWLLRPLLAAYRPIDRWLVGQADAILTTGEFARERLLEAYGRPGVIVTPGVSLTTLADDRASARARLGLGPDDPVVLSVAFLHPRKRIDLLLRAWAEVERRRPGAILLVLGEGPEAKPLQELASGLGLRGVRFCGYVPEDDLVRYYRAADLLVHVARLETFGLTILEAGAEGVPAVVADEGGPRYTVLDGETGLRVPAGSGPLADALSDLLGDRDRSRALGQAARRHVLDRYTWERGAAEFLALCRDLGVATPPAA